MMTPKEVAAVAAKALDDRKGVDIRLLEITDVTTLADYFLICTGTSSTHVKSLCDAVEEAMDNAGEPASAGRDTAAAPGFFWTLGAWWCMCSPRRRGSSTIWSGCGATQSLWRFPISCRSK